MHRDPNIDDARSLDAPPSYYVIALLVLSDLTWPPREDHSRSADEAGLHIL